MRLSEFNGKRILILGYGREGQDSFAYLQPRLEATFGIADQKERAQFPRGAFKKGVELHLGKGYLKAVKDYDVIIKSPGIPSRLLKLKKGQQVFTQAGLFLELCPGQVIGVTGTKGKSTTASLIFHVLKAAKKKVHLVGNIGEPALSYLEKATEKDIFVYELSSFQLEYVRKSPPIAVFLNLYAEHLDHHGNFAKYVWAKANIARFQSSDDFLIYNKTNKVVANVARLSKARKLPYVPKHRGKGWLAFGEPIFLVAKLLGVPRKEAEKAMQSFKPLPHRLEYIGTYKGICFVNDSLATIPEATIAALDAIGKQAVTLIAGGYDRGVSMRKLSERLENSSVQTLILFPDTDKKILRALKKKPKNVFAVKSMEEAVRLAFEYTPKNKTCLLSPAASSFNLFRDYQERGEKFVAFVKKYGKSAKT